MGEQLVEETLTPAHVSLLSTDICEGQQPAVDISRVLNTIFACKDHPTKLMLGKYLKREVQILSKQSKVNLDWVNRLVNESLDTTDDYLAQLFVEVAFYLPYKQLSEILRDLSREISNIFSTKGKPRTLKLLWVDVFFKAYLETAYHEENSGFQTGNALDLIRTAVSAMIREFRLVHEQSVIGTPAKEDSLLVVPMDMVQKLNSYFDYFFAGKLPDEWPQMTQDQKDLLKPLVSVVTEQVLDNLEQLLLSSRGLEELLAMEVFVLLMSALRFRSEMLQVERKVQGNGPVDELIPKIQAVYQVITSRLLLSFESSAGYVCVHQLRLAVKCCYRVYFPNLT